MVKVMLSLETILTTVNAPYSEQLDAQSLVHCLKDQAAAKSVPGHMSSFFGEISPDLQQDFANMFGISKPDLIEAARAFACYSGETYQIAA